VGGVRGGVAEGNGFSGDGGCRHVLGFGSVL
jgi:hypothetical protein